MHICSCQERLVHQHLLSRQGVGVCYTTHSTLVVIPLKWNHLKDVYEAVGDEVGEDGGHGDGGELVLEAAAVGGGGLDLAEEEFGNWRRMHAY